MRQWLLFFCWVPLHLASAHCWFYMQDGLTLSMDTAQCSQIALFDDGGLSGDYAPGQHSVMRVVSRPGTHMEILFTYFESEFPDDHLLIFDGPDTTAPLIAELSGSPFTISALFYSSADTITLLFVSDTDTFTYGGFSVIITQLGQAPARLVMGNTARNTFTLPACSPHRFVVYDPGGALADYPPSFSDTLFFVPAASSFMVVSFPYQFTLGSGDTLFIYAGYTLASDSLLSFFTRGTHRGDTITVPWRNAPLAMVFKSDGVQEAPGWQAWVWCSDTMSNSVLYCGGDGAFTLQCTAPVKVYDDGSPWLLHHREAYGHYSRQQNSTFTFAARDSSVGVSLHFLFVYIGDSSCEDELVIYDGWDSSRMALLRAGAMTAPLRRDSVVALSGALTLSFRSSNPFTAGGWEALAMCTRKRNFRLLPLHQPHDSMSTCSAIITDPAGLHLPYRFAGEATATVCPPGNLYLTAKMIGGYELAEGDTLKIYAVSPHSSQKHLLAILTGHSGYELLSTRKPGECLQLELYGQGIDSAEGWSAVVECSWKAYPWQTWMGEGMRHTCRSHIYDRGGPLSFYRGAGQKDTLTIIAPANATLLSHYWEIDISDSVLLFSTGDTLRLTGRFWGDTPLISQDTTATIIAYTQDKQTGWWWNWQCEEAVGLALSVSGDVLLCPGDSLTIAVWVAEGSPSVVEHIRWNTGEQSTTITVREPGYYWACAQTTSGAEFCSPVLHAYADEEKCSVTVNRVFSPAQPTTITVKWIDKQTLEVWGIPAGYRTSLIDITGKALEHHSTQGQPIRLRIPEEAQLLIIEFCPYHHSQKCQHLLVAPPTHLKQVQ